jgi:hypothetical protein
MPQFGGGLNPRPAIMEKANYFNVRYAAGAEPQ